MPKPKPRRRSPEPESTSSSDAAGRPFWSGTISFGLVSIPVNLFPATRNSRVSLRLLGPEGAPVKRDYYSPESGEDLGEPEVARGFETSRGKVVTVTDEELERLAPEKSRDIHLRVFVPRAEIPPLYFVKGYILAPADKSGRAYRLLARVMEERDQAGVATFVMRGKEYLVAILAGGGILRAQTLRFYDEVREPEDVGLPIPKEAVASSIRTFRTAIKRLSKRSLDESEMQDEYADRMLSLIEKKRAIHQDVVESESEGPRRQPAKVVDLMEVLKKSLSQGKSKAN